MGNSIKHPIFEYLNNRLKNKKELNKILLSNLRISIAKIKQKKIQLQYTHNITTVKWNKLIRKYIEFGGLLYEINFENIINFNKYFKRKRRNIWNMDRLISPVYKKYRKRHKHMNFDVFCRVYNNSIEFDTYCIGKKYLDKWLNSIIPIKVLEEMGTRYMKFVKITKLRYGKRLITGKHWEVKNEIDNILKKNKQKEILTFFDKKRIKFILNTKYFEFSKKLNLKQFNNYRVVMLKQKYRNKLKASKYFFLKELWVPKIKKKAPIIINKYNKIKLKNKKNKLNLILRTTKIYTMKKKKLT